VGAARLVDLDPATLRRYVDACAAMQLTLSAIHSARIRATGCGDAAHLAAVERNLELLRAGLVGVPEGHRLLLVPSPTLQDLVPPRRRKGDPDAPVPPKRAKSTPLPHKQDVASLQIDPPPLTAPARSDPPPVGCAGNSDFLDVEGPSKLLKTCTCASRAESYEGRYGQKRPFDSDASQRTDWTLTSGCGLDREVKLLRMREPQLQLDVQQHVLRKNREVELLRTREVELLRMRQSQLELDVQQLVARNRELELQLKVYKVAYQPILRVAEAEGARWCAPAPVGAHGGLRRPCCFDVPCLAL
jgi:hypothetical protein